METPPPHRLASRSSLARPRVPSAKVDANTSAANANTSAANTNTARASANASARRPRLHLQHPPRPTIRTRMP